MAKLKFETGSKEEEQQPKGGLEDRGVIDRVDEIIAQALGSGATDLHVEPGPVESRVRLRVEGTLRDVTTFPSTLHGKVANRFKILGGMDITKSRTAQTGFFKVESESGRAECNAFIFPSTLGEKVTLAIQTKRGLELSLEHLGFYPDVLKAFKDALTKPHGLVLIAGPPASGRTTTCYASLAFLNSPQKALAAFEYTNKYEIAGLVQGKPAPQVDFKFVDGVKAMMDSAPDVALVGEVQDPEVARLAIQGAFSRRIVLARMAAHDAANALVTLMDMGVQPFLLTAAVNAVLAQRLLKRICDRCKEPYVPPPQLLGEIGFNMPPDVQFYRGRGCAACGGSGYRGSLALFELVVLNEEINNLLVARRPPQDIREAVARTGLPSLKRDGVNKVVMGYTSIEEVMNAL